MKIILFIKDEKEEVPLYSQRQELSYQYIYFNSRELNDLLLIAKYRIIHFPTSIIIDEKDNILMKIKGIIPDSYIDKLMEKVNE